MYKTITCILDKMLIKEHGFFNKLNVGWNSFISSQKLFSSFSHCSVSTSTASFATKSSTTVSTQISSIQVSPPGSSSFCYHKRSFIIESRKMFRKSDMSNMNDLNGLNDMSDLCGGSHGLNRRRCYSTKNSVKLEQKHTLSRIERKNTSEGGANASPRGDIIYTDIVIIGAGVIGAAISSRLSKEFPNHILIEKESRPGQGISSRSSEVIHAGLYYKEGSLKSQLCRVGNALMYRACDRLGVRAKRCGKWLVATTESEHEYLEQLKTFNDNAGFVRLQWLKYCGQFPNNNLFNNFFNNNYSNNTNNIHLNINNNLSINNIFKNNDLGFSNLENKLLEDSFSILESLDTGIVDSSSLVDALLHFNSFGNSILSEDERAIQIFNSEVIDILPLGPENYEILVQSGGEQFIIRSNIVINAAGLFASKLSQDLFQKACPHHPDISKYNLHFVKGNYFTYQERNLFHRLIYPVPDKEITSLGVHLTIDLQGNIRFGPDVEYLGMQHSNINYKVNDERQTAFFQSIQRYIPTGLEKDKLIPAYAGVRPKLQGPNEPFRDFIIQEESDKDCKGFISLCGIESPGLTSSLAIANYVSNLLSCSSQYDFKP